MIDQTSRTKFMRKKIEKKPTKRMYQTSISQVATRPVRLMALTRCRILVKNMVRLKAKFKVTKWPTIKALALSYVKDN